MVLGDGMKLFLFTDKYAYLVCHVNLSGVPEGVYIGFRLDFFKVLVFFFVTAMKGELVTGLSAIRLNFGFLVFNIALTRYLKERIIEH